MQKGKQGMLQEMRSPFHHLETADIIQGQKRVPQSGCAGRDDKSQSSSQERWQHPNPKARLRGSSYHALQGSLQSPTEAAAGPAPCAMPHDSNIC